MDLKNKALEELKRTKEDLAWLAYYDELTSLPNRVFFNQILHKAINHAKRHQKILAILFINLDGFKEISNRFGQTIADLVLKEISTRLSSSLRDEDLLARLEGDEFIVLLNDINKPKFASAVAEKILKNCSQPIKVDTHEVSVTASIGISVFPNDANSLEDLVKNADTALFQSKHAGGNTYQFHAQELDIEAREYIKLKTHLLNAIQNNEFSLYYQPKLHLKKGSITGIEALIRWVHPELGIVNPATFIPVAEEAGLIAQIGEWALREACKMNKHWQEEGYEHMTVAVNLSHKQFHDAKLPQTITNVLNETGLSPQYLELEMTEETVMDHIETAAAVLEKLKSTGVQISLDHFGIGYTSISHLKLFPVNVLKIDQSFIKGIPNNPNDVAITNAFIQLAHNLGFEVIAEGVETAEQVQYLSNQGCDMVQGYFLSHPLPAQKIELQFKKLSDRVLL